jgi:pyruvate/2-oxoglutarate dehydrogenase complex dihydrolipoamide acyltransferase (E2) component
VPAAPTAATAPVKPPQKHSALHAATGDAGFISPRVRARLDAHGLTVSDLSVIAGTGRDGRVTAQDVDAYAQGGEPLTAVRQAVAAAMMRSWSRPLATVAMPVRLDPLLEHRRTVTGRPSLTVYALRALAQAIAAAPTPLRGRLVGNRVHQCAGIDLAVAVEVDDGVITPVVRKVDGYDLAALEAKVSGVVESCRNGRVSDLGDAIATVSNYGTFGITWATPIPLAGQAFILGIGAPVNAPEWDPASKGFTRIRQAELTLTFDHRLADGGAAGRLLAKVVELLQNPSRL